MTNEELIKLARATHGSDDIEIDDNAVVSCGDDGAFVQAWVWVRYPDAAPVSSYAALVAKAAEVLE